MAEEKEKSFFDYLGESVKQNPRMRSIEKYFPGYSDAFSTSSFSTLPVVAITRGQLMSKLGELVEGIYSSKKAATLSVGQKIPRKLLKEVDEFESFKNLPESKSKQVEEGSYRGAIWSKRNPYKSMDTEKTTIGIDSKIFNPSTSAHEFAHELYYMLPEAEQKFLSKTFQNMSSDDINNLIKKTGTRLYNSSELFSEAFAQYLLEGDKSKFKEFPPFVRHIVKKYYRLMK